VNGSGGILMLAVGLVAGLVLSQAMKPSGPLVPTAPVRGPSNYWDVIVAAMPIARDIFD
jgi:hypothetical protein